MFRKSLLLISIIAACRESGPKVPDGPASISARITMVEQSGDGSGSIRLEARPEDMTSSAQARVLIAPGTTVIAARGKKAADFSALRPGQWVRVWFVGPVLQSQPLQATAGTIVIDSTRRR